MKFVLAAFLIVIGCAVIIIGNEYLQGGACT